LDFIVPCAILFGIFLKLEEQVEDGLC